MRNKTLNLKSRVLRHRQLHKMRTCNIFCGEVANLYCTCNPVYSSTKAIFCFICFLFCFLHRRGKSLLREAIRNRKGNSIVSYFPFYIAISFFFFYFFHGNIAYVKPVSLVAILIVILGFVIFNFLFCRVMCNIIQRLKSRWYVMW